jgi:hypothetical protein
MFSSFISNTRRWFCCRFAMGFVSVLITGAHLTATAAEKPGSTDSRSSIKIERITLPTVRPEADANIRRRYEIEKAAWVWHPDVPAGEETALLFRNEFTFPKPVDHDSRQRRPTV